MAALRVADEETVRFPSPFLEASSRPLLRTSVFTLVFLCVHCGLPNLALGQQEDETAAPVPPPEDDPPKGAETPDDSSPTGERKEESGEEQVDVTAQDEAERSSDEVIESAGARVFLEEHAAEALADKVLDAQLDEGGAVRFAIAQA